MSKAKSGHGLRQSGIGLAATLTLAIGTGDLVPTVFAQEPVMTLEIAPRQEPKTLPKGDMKAYRIEGGNVQAVPAPGQVVPTGAPAQAVPAPGPAQASPAPSAPPTSGQAPDGAAPAAKPD